MKQFAKIYSLCLILLILFGVSACNDDWGVRTGNVKEGVPTTISLNFSTSSQTIQSRVEQPGETEYNVSSVYLFAFNSNGDKTGGQAFDSQSGGLTGTYGNNSFTGTLNGFNVLSGSNQTLYALANFDNENFTLSKSLDEINRIEDLEDLTVQIAEGRITLNRYSFFMLGKEEGVTISENGTVTASQGDVTLKMERLDAKITFNIVTEIKGAIAGTMKFIPKSFLVKQLPLSAMVVEAKENSSDIIYKSMTEDMKVTNFDEVGETKSSFNFYMFENSVAPPVRGAEGGSGKWIDATERDTHKAESMYALREKEEKSQLGEEDAAHPGMTEQNTGNYVYAPEHATFVEIAGELSYERINEFNVTEYVNVSARYTIHLGETGSVSDANNETLVNNYMVKRNTHYTYTITLTGIDSYKAEVDSDEERPGMEGDVIIAGDQVKAIDSHYARTRIKFTRQALKEGLSWIVQTPFDKGIKLYSSNENSIKDYKWILFAVNKEFAISKNGNGYNNSNMVKFPGYDAYDGGASTLTTQTNASTDEGNSAENIKEKGQWINRMSKDAYYYLYKRYLSENACLRDVNQLINHLKTEAYNPNSTIFEKDENDEEVVYVTAFVDEYVYIYNPTNQEYTDPVAGIADPERLKLWTQVVNGSERMMHICVKGAQYSPDGETSWSNSVVTFRQAPIYSMYDVATAEAVTNPSAWGTESILETKPLPAVDDSHQPAYTLTMDNGRKNTLAFFVESDGNTANGTKWTDVLSRNAANVEDGEHELNSEYRNIWFACMTRNRDLNGDNVINPEEVRWFLASIDELTDLWIGENALPQTAKLYKGDGTYMEHMASSSGSTSTPWIIWAEEGASRGQYNDGSYTNKETDGRDYTYRCIRYLGISLDDVDATPTDYVQVTPATPEVSSYGTSYRIDVSRLSNAAKRDLQDSGRELPIHYERGTDYVNMPYTAFEVLITPQGQGATARRWKDYDDNEVKGLKSMMNYGGYSRLCPSGYRVPNQRELMLMYTSLNENNGYRNVPWSDSYWSSTQFSYSNNQSLYKAERPGFGTSGINLILTSTAWVWDNNEYKPSGDNIAGKVRCVRDVK